LEVPKRKKALLSSGRRDGPVGRCARFRKFDGKKTGKNRKKPEKVDVTLKHGYIISI
jgi:hypothetical protein